MTTAEIEAFLRAVPWIHGPRCHATTCVCDPWPDFPAMAQTVRGLIVVEVEQQLAPWKTAGTIESYQAQVERLRLKVEELEGALWAARRRSELLHAPPPSEKCSCSANKAPGTECPVHGEAL